MFFDRAQTHREFVGDRALRLSLQTVPPKNTCRGLSQRINRIVNCPHLVNRQQTSLAIGLRAAIERLAPYLGPLRIAMQAAMRCATAIDRQIVQDTIEIGQRLVGHRSVERPDPDPRIVENVLGVFAGANPPQEREQPWPLVEKYLL